MMKKSPKRERFETLLFSLSDDGVELRNQMRGRIRLITWAALSATVFFLALFGVIGKSNFMMFAAIIAAMSALKYLPLMSVSYNLARKMAAQYLDDVYELNDEDLAADFLEEVTFGYGSEKITIKEGKISEKDERSPLILIGGPGIIQVNLDSAALLEKVNGEPEVIYPRSKPWNLGRFERIREIGKYDEVGKREYAIINLRDQFASNIVVKSRTKDGIPIEAHDVKAIFSVARKDKEERATIQGEAYNFDEDAVKSLVYNQTTITPEPSSAAGVAFPWNVTAIPLIMSELERIITSHTLSEILASISQKEINAVSDNEQSIAQMRVELTGGQPDLDKKKKSAAPSFKSRSMITAQFFEKAFTEKAAAMGVYVEWIDVGTWKLLNEQILEKHKDALTLSRENAKRRGAVERLKKQHESKEFLRLVEGVVVANYAARGGLSKETISFKELNDLLKGNPELANNPHFMRQYDQFRDPSKKGAVSISHEILKAFRKELLAGKTLIQNDNKISEEDKQRDLDNIEKALRNINALVPAAHWVKKTA
ncbi:MAG: hypothetical protein PHQ36_14395 [Anaerolineales bacterium]|nr:hypothetical protein [Anaerolineales bacterium]